MQVIKHSVSVMLVEQMESLYETVSSTESKTDTSNLSSVLPKQKKKPTKRNVKTGMTSAVQKDFLITNIIRINLMGLTINVLTVSICRKRDN